MILSACGGWFCPISDSLGLSTMPVMLFAWDLAATRPGSAAVRQKEIEEQRGLLYSLKKAKSVQ